MVEQLWESSAYVWYHIRDLDWMDGKEREHVIIII